MNGGVVVELHVPDFEPIRDRYKELGFATVWEREPEQDKGDLWAFKQSHFRQFDPETPRGYAVEIVLMVDDIHDYYDKVEEAAKVIDGLEVVKPLAMKPWGKHDFRVTDPAGFYLRSPSHTTCSIPARRSLAAKSLRRVGGR
jgi:hypothetical protein